PVLQPFCAQSPFWQPWNSGHSSFAVQGFLHTFLRHCSPFAGSQSSSSTHSTQLPARQMVRLPLVQFRVVVQEVSWTQRSFKHSSVHRFTQSGSVQIELEGLYCG